MSGPVVAGAWPLVSLAGVVGLAVGSFLNVVVHRVPLGLSVVHPRSACPGCSTPVAPRDNVPVLSWFLLRRRCRSCATPISARYPLVELATAGLFSAVTAWVAHEGRWALLPVLLYLAAAGLALALIDLDVHRLPDAIVLPAYPVTAALLGLAAVVEHDGAAALRALAGGLLLYGLYFALAVAKPGGMGFGDVKLAGVLGAVLGYAGWSALVVGAFSAFVLGGVVGVVLLTTSALRRRDHLPFGPFMLAGTALGVVAGGATVRWYLALSGVPVS